MQNIDADADADADAEPRSNADADAVADDFFRRPKLLACMLFHRVCFFFPAVNDGVALPIAYFDTRVRKSHIDIAAMKKSLRALKTKTHAKDVELCACITLLLGDLSGARNGPEVDEEETRNCIVWGAQLERILALARQQFQNDDTYVALDGFMSRESHEPPNPPQSVLVSDEDYVAAKRCFMALFARSKVVVDEFKNLSPNYVTLNERTEENAHHVVDTRHSRRRKFVNWFRSVRLKFARFTTATFRMNCLNRAKDHNFSVCSQVAGIRTLFAFLESNQRIRTRYPEFEAIRTLQLHKHIRGDASDDTQFALLQFLVVLFFPLAAADTDDAGASDRDPATRELISFMCVQVRKLVRDILTARKAELVNALSEIRFMCVNMVRRIYHKSLYWFPSAGLIKNSFRQRVYRQFVGEMVASTKEITRKMDFFDNTLYSKFESAFPEQMNTPALWSIQYDRTDLRAFKDSMLEEFIVGNQNDEKLYMEEYVRSSRHYYKKRFALNYLAVLLHERDSQGKNIKHQPSLISDQFYEKTPFYDDDMQEYMALLERLMQIHITTSGPGENTRALSSYFETMRHEAIRDAAREVCDDFMAANIGMFIVSSRAFSFFVSSATDPRDKSKVSWKDFIEYPDETEFANDLIGKYYQHYNQEEQKQMFERIKESAANETAFQNFRFVLTDPLYFANNIQPPDDEKEIPLLGVSLCGMIAHGSCRMNRDNSDVLSKQVPENLTVYHITDVLTDLKISMNSITEHKKLEIFLKEDLKKHRLLTENETITEKKLIIDLFVNELRKIRVPDKCPHPERGVVSAADKIDQARNIYLSQKSFIVRKYDGGEQFPFRSWSSGPEKFPLFYIPVINQPNGTDNDLISYERVYSDIFLEDTREARVLIIVDFACKSFPGEHLHNNMWLNSPEKYATLLKRQYKNGKIIAMAGGGEGGGSRYIGKTVKKASSLVKFRRSQRLR